MKAYILSQSCVSAQACVSGRLPETWMRPEEIRLPLQNPDYEKFLDPKLLRRMGRVIRMGGASALDCMKRTGTEAPDAIIVGTAQGCLQDSESFLRKMISQQEQMLSPTAFIQSTHNTVAAQVALMLKCNAYNNTFSHRGFSFEHALTDAMLLLSEQRNRIVLTGGVDELTDTSLHIMQRLGIYKTEPHLPRGLQAGEGAAFFSLSGQARGNTVAVVHSPVLRFRPDIRQWEQGLQESLGTIGWADLDLIIHGHPGQSKLGSAVQSWLKEHMSGTTLLDYKPYCGEFATASAFALWMASGIIADGQIPEQLGHSNRPVRRVLVCNNFLDRYCSFFLVTHADV